MPAAKSKSKAGGGVGGVALSYENEDIERVDHFVNEKGYRTIPILHLNGHPIPASLACRARPNQTLLNFLRNEVGLTGTKLGCGEGGCGACTVLISRYSRYSLGGCDDGVGGSCGDVGGEVGADGANGVEGGKGRLSVDESVGGVGKGRIVHMAVNACLFPVLAADGCHITTVEGVGSWRAEYRGLKFHPSNQGNRDNQDNGKDNGEEKKEDYLHPIQRAMVDMHGSQCGFCTPGIIMALYGLFAAEGSYDYDNRNATDNYNNDEDDKLRIGIALGAINLASVRVKAVRIKKSMDGATKPIQGTKSIKAVGKGPTTSHLEEHLDGNLCRCTGYRPIWDAALSLCVDAVDKSLADVEDGGAVGAVGPCGTPCRACPERESCEMDCNVKDKQVNGDGCSNGDGDLTNNGDKSDKAKVGVNGVCCSSTADKILHYQKLLPSKHSDTWWNQPNEMFPRDLWPLTLEERKTISNSDSYDGVDNGDGGKENKWMQLKQQAETQNLLSKPLLVVDNSIHKGGTWFQPTSLVELLDLFREFSKDSKDTTDDGKNGSGGGGGGIKMVVGNTEVGIETKFKHAVYPRMIHPSESIHTLYDIFCTSSHFHIGACSSLSVLQHKCHEYMKLSRDISAKRRSTRFARIAKTAKPIHDMLRWFASTQIRNVACLGGNLATASPISDMNPLLMALGATLVLASRPDPLSTSEEVGSGKVGMGEVGGGITRRHVAVSDFFLSYRTVDKRPDEVIERIDVPLMSTPIYALSLPAKDGTSKFEYAAPFKQARRREDDISIVTSGMHIIISPKGTSNEWIIEDILIAFGGMAPKTILATKTMHFLQDSPFDANSFTDAQKVLREELAMPQDVPGGQSEYRLALACGFLWKFYLFCVGEIRRDVEAVAVADMAAEYPPIPTIESEEESGAKGFVDAPKPSIRGVQRFPAPKVAVGLEGSEDGKDSKSSVTKEMPLAAKAAMEAANASSTSKGSTSSTKTDSDVIVGQPATHASAPLHCTGEALYADDIPAPENLLHGSLLLASKCGYDVKSIDASPAMSIPGIVGVFTHQDIIKLGGDNRMGPILLDEVAFLPMGQKVEFVGQVLGIVVGVSQEIAEEGVRAVKVKYEEAGEEGPNENRVIVTIEEAIRAKSFWNDAIHEMQRGGNVEEILKLKQVDGKELVVVEGSFRSGGQEHFYLEPNSTLAIPSESATNLTIYTSTQAITKTQDFVARVTNTPQAKVVVRMKRMGGGFGGKETRSVFSSVAAAVAAKITNRAVRLTLNRDTDMSITGGRHAFLGIYKAGVLVDEDGGSVKSVKLHALDVQIYNNGGCHFDLTGPVLDRALFHVDNCYLWPHFHSVGTPCKTSQPPHTAFRGFGGPQGMALCEHIMDHLAVACNVSGDKLRRENMYQLQDCTPFGMRFGGQFTGPWNVPSMWDRLHAELNVPARRLAAAEFNSKHKWIKRGVAFIPTKFGIAFTAKFMNQGGALVHLYTDGTVLVSHGGTEMGQGLHTKVCQVAAQAFGIPLEDVYVNDSSTDKVANTIPSAASMSTDMYGMATLDACRQILKRLQPIKEKLPPNAKLSDVAKAAFYERVDLSAHGFFALDNDRCGYDWNKNAPDDYPVDLPENSWKGHPFNYFTQAVALAEVEIEVLTGNHRTIRADILVDVGSSINPAIDIGQIEGAFIQGMGWCTMEEVIYADDGHTWIRPRARVFTTGPGTYKIPAFNDVPETFNVSILEDASNPFAVHSSKAIGEPPFFLGCSVFYAIKDAVMAARGGPSSGYFEFRMPATSERIRMACGDKISVECIAGEATSFQPKGSF